jgi:transcriptional regulator with XRE-family HTH domain
MQEDWTASLTGLRESRRRRGLSQKKVASKLGISQSTVSRRERKPPKRHSDATFVLCRYAETSVGKTGGLTLNAIQKSIEEIWSKSEAHATALSVIIDAFLELCRAESTGGGLVEK